MKMHTQSVVIGAVVAAIVFGGAGYYEGTQHAASGASRQFAGGNVRGAAGGPGGVGGLGGRGANGGFVGGQIIAKDDTSITLKEQNGSTKIVLLSGSAQISKFAAGSPTDLSVGTNVMVTGSANSDGSLTAQTVQIRPAGAPIGGPGTRTTQ